MRNSPGGTSLPTMEWRSPQRLSAQPPDLRRQNLSAILRTLLIHGPMARAELSQVIGLAPGSVTKLTSELISAGVIREQRSTEEPRMPGRPRVPVSIDGRRLRAAGVHIGLLRTTIGLVDLAGGIVAERVLNHRSRTPSSIIKQAVTGLRRLAASEPPGSVLGVGASIGGLIDPDTGVVLEHPSLDWEDVALRDQLTEGLGLPVVLDSTMRALALAERSFGTAKSVPSLLHVFVGNIVGAAFLVDGKAHLGPASAAGYLVHLPTGIRSRLRCSCGRYDCLQASASDVAVVSEAQEQGVLPLSEGLDELTGLAAAGDKAAIRLLRKRAERVGAAVALLVEILDPHLVVLGGGVVDDPAFITDIRASVAAHVHRPLAVPADELVVATSFGTHAVMFSSAALFLDAFYRHPTAFSVLNRA